MVDIVSLLRRLPVGEMERQLTNDAVAAGAFELTQKSGQRGLPVASTGTKLRHMLINDGLNLCHLCGDGLEVEDETKGSGRLGNCEGLLELLETGGVLSRRSKKRL